MTHHPPPNPFHTALTQHLNRNVNERQAMLLQRLSVGAMFVMALPCVLQGIREAFRLLNHKEAEKDHGHGHGRGHGR